MSFYGGSPKGGFWTQKRVIEPYMMATLMSLGRRSESKPVDEAIARAPEWYEQLVLTFTIIIGLLEASPEIDAVESLRFDCDQFLDEDQLLLRGNLPIRAARAVLGNIMENTGHLVVNETHARDFHCDCRGSCDVTIYLPGAETWLSQEMLDEIVARSKSSG